MLDLLSERNAFRIDRAVAEFGNALSAELEDVTGKRKQDIQAKREAVLKRWLSLEETASSANPSGFKDPAVKRKV